MQVTAFEVGVEEEGLAVGGRVGQVVEGYGLFVAHSARNVPYYD